MDTNLADFLQILLIVSGVSLALAGFLFAYVVWRVRKIDIPPTATFIQAIKVTPFSVVLLLDLLDLSLDFFSTPISWTILGYLGLKPLRGVTAVEGLIPATQAIPTMSLVWLAVRLLNLE
ncbi:MAG: hypothetical protein PVF49_02915 [Anaerolineales bacterium]|jgi:hypothetical protein